MVNKYTQEYQQQINAATEKAYKRMKIKEEDIDRIFNSLDTDKSGSLDMNEAKAFFVGKYNLNDDTLKAVFEKYDYNHNGTIDLQEFRVLCDQINKSVDVFALEEMQYMMEYLNYIMPYTTFACCCCLCTLCQSWTCASYCTKKRSEEVMEHAESTETRLNEHILMDLQKGISMDDRNDSRIVEAVPLKD